MMAQTDLAFPIVDNIVIGCPGNAKATADFYAGLLRMQVIRDDWLMIAKEADAEPRLAFDNDLEPDRTVVWLDPDRPAQVRLELPASDVAAATEAAMRLGAVLLERNADAAMLQDPAGHPLLVYDDPSDVQWSPGGHPLSGRVGRVVLECGSPHDLAAFYAAFLDMPEVLADQEDRVVIGRTDGRLPSMAFQQSSAEPPRWPDPAHPQQIHLDIWVDDQQAAVDRVLRAGAGQLPAMGGSCPVFADPAGHPFCICT